MRVCVWCASPGCAGTTEAVGGGELSSWPVSSMCESCCVSVLVLLVVSTSARYP